MDFLIYICHIIPQRPQKFTIPESKNNKNAPHMCTKPEYIQHLKMAPNKDSITLLGKKGTQFYPIRCWNTSI